MKVNLLEVELELMEGFRDAVERGREPTDGELLHIGAFQAVQALRLWKEREEERWKGSL